MRFPDITLAGLGCVVMVVCALIAPARAADPPVVADEKGWTARGQSTYIYQAKPGFPAAYSGANSLRADRERSYSLTATLYLGSRLWHGGEVYFNPELTMGLPLSNLGGLGGFTNGELARVSGRDPTLYRARLFLRHTIGLGGGTEAVEEDDNQIATRRDRHRLVLTAGNFSALDLFDDNPYAKDPRTQFMNWSFFAPGAWDYPADARGYTWGLAAEYVRGDWTLRAGRFAMPRESNGLRLNPDLRESHGDAAEIERRHSLGGREGRVHVILFRNRARMGSFRDALAESETSGTTPALVTSRTGRVKTGFATGFNQALAPDVGVFVRYSRGDGRSETFAFTEIDRSLSAGVSIDGLRWSRPADTLGIALARNGISADRRDYLAAGGLGFFLGDGRLAPAGERILEAYYRYALSRHASLSADYQHIAHPGYNRDRGPVSVFSVRLHASF